MRAILGAAPILALGHRAVGFATNLPIGRRGNARNREDFPPVHVRGLSSGALPPVLSKFYMITG